MNNLSEVEILERLISFNTVSRNSNLELIDFIRSYLSSLGIQSETIFDATKSKANLVASIGPLERPGFVLSGHTDVVPIDGQDWTRDPFRLTREGGKLFGRGTTDMKGFVACVLARAPRMLAKPLQIPLHLVFSYDEEVGCLGVHGIIRHIDKAIPKPIAAFIGEPTLMGVVDGHKGSTGLLTTVLGKSCHSSRPDHGVNAIFHAADLIAELRRYANELSAAPDSGSPFEVPYTSVSVGVIQGGTARNSIPGDCMIQWDIRATKPGVVESLIRRFSAFVEQTALPPMRARYADASIVTKMVYDVPPLVPDTGSIAEILAKKFAGKNETATVNYGSEAGFFQAAGIPSVLCGPGGDAQAHIADEWIAADQLGAYNDFLDKLIAHARNG